MSKHKILVTGFKPFLGETINPSEILLEHIKRDFAVSRDAHGSPVQTLLLPVSFEQALKELDAHLADHQYDHIFLLGQAGGREKICLERVGLNWIETQNPDEDGFTPQQGPIDSQEVPALFCKLPLSDWVQEMTEKSLPAKVSLSAGGYVCNYVYFKTLQKFARSNRTWACFIHVPYLAEQVVGKSPGTPFLDLAIMKQTLYVILNKYL